MLLQVCKESTKEVPPPMFPSDDGSCNFLIASKKKKRLVIRIIS